MELKIVDTTSKNEYLSIQDSNKLRDIFYDYLVSHGKTPYIAESYLKYSYKYYDMIRFVSLVLVEVEGKPYFIENLYYGDNNRIFLKGEYAKKKYFFELI